MKARFKFRYTGLYFLFVSYVSLVFSSSLHAAQISFTAGNAAVAADVNANFSELYGSMWTKTGSDLSYSAGNIGIGVATPGVKLGVVGGSAITLAGATGFGVFGATTGNHVAIDSTQIQTKASATTVAHLSLNPLGGFVGVGTAPGVKFHVDGGTAVSTTSGSGYAAFGAATGQHIAIDMNRIQSKGSGTTAANLAINPLGGNVGIGTSTPESTLEVKGNVSFTGSGTAADLTLVNAGVNRVISFSTLGATGACPGPGACRRWSFIALNGAESGTNAGGDLVIRNHDDSGTLIRNALYISRATAATTFNTDTQTTFNGSGGTCVLTGAAGSCTSDIRMKTNFAPLTGNLAKLYEIHGRSYNLIKDMKSGRHIGLIAQDVEKVFPELVSVDQQSGMKMLNYAGMVAPLTEAMKELRAEKDTQVLALQKQLSVAVSQSNREKASADNRIATLEKSLAEQGRRLNDELLARKQQEIRLAKLEQMLQRSVVARR